MSSLFKTFCFFFPLLLAADRFQFSSAIGYRRDIAKTSISGSYSSTDLLNSVEIASGIRFFFPYLYVALEGDVGWYVSGSGRRTLQLGAAEGNFGQSSGGFFTDGQFNLGVPFGPVLCRILPQGSFGLFYQQIKQGESRPARDGMLTCDLSHSRLKRLWFGPGAGADLIFQPHSAWIFSAGYAYYFLHFDQKFDVFSDLLEPSAEYFVWQKYRASTSAHGQKISGKVAAQIGAEWRLNLCFNAFLFSANDKPSSIRQNFTQVFPVQNSFSEVTLPTMNAAWQAYSALVEIEYFF